MPLFASDIVTQACQIAKCPGFTTQAQIQLNLILEDIAENYDSPASAYTFTSFPISPNGGNGTGNAQSIGTNWYLLKLPTSSVPVQSNARYLRTHSVFYSVSGAIFYLNQIPLEDYDRLFQGPGISNYPYSYVVDTTGDPNLATVQMAFYPPPNTNLTLTIRNQYRPNDIAVGAFASTVPWFPNQSLLLRMLTLRMFEYTGDRRADQMRKQIYGDPMSNDPGDLSRYLKMQDDKENYAMTVKLDPRRFQNVDRLKATKVTVW